MPDGRTRQVAFVTRYYADLRGGLIRAAVGPQMIAVGIIGDLVGRTLAFLIVFALSVVLTSTLLNRWMDRRFGRVVSGSDGQRRVMLFGLLAFFLATRADHVVDGAGPSILFLSASAFGFWLTIRCWPYGVMNLLPTLVAAAMAMDFATVNSVETLADWERRAYTFTLAAWTVAGLSDMLLLTRLLRGRTDDVNAATERS